MKIKRETKVTDEIPTASMADVSFLLIVFFMITSTFAATRGLDFALPEQEDNPPVVEKEESVLVEIQPGGQLLVDGTPMPLDGVLDYLRPKLERNPLKPVIIRPDPASEYGYMVDVFDELRLGAEKGVEVKNISIPTQREIQAFWF
jgi:biopolymer transport protein ExbD